MQVPLPMPREDERLLTQQEDTTGWLRNVIMWIKWIWGVASMTTLLAPTTM